MLTAYASGGELGFAVFLLVAGVLFGLVAARARHRQVELERGRRAYPCARGSAGDSRWPDRRP